MSETYCPLFDKNFALSNAKSVAKALESATVTGVGLLGFNPPVNPPRQVSDPIQDNLSGHFSVMLAVETGEDLELSVDFGEQSKDGNLIRESLAASTLNDDMKYPGKAGLTAINFNEAWCFLDALLKELKVESVTIQFGA